MGLASSQARLLNLTARMHQIEYKAERLEAMKLQMANESRRVYEDYLDALDKTKVQMKTLTTDGSVTYREISNYADFTAAGYALVVHNGAEAIVCEDEAALKTAIGKVFKGADNEALDITEGLKAVNFATTLTNLINSGVVTIVTKENGAFPASLKGDGTDDPEDILKFTYAETSVATNTGLQEITDEVALRKAEAKYEADMKAIDLKDRKYDTDLAALDTERNAIKQEMETLKTVAKDNVERTFKIFS